MKIGKFNARSKSASLGSAPKRRSLRKIVASVAAFALIGVAGVAGVTAAQADDVPFAAEVTANNTSIYSGDQLNYQVNVTCSQPNGCGDVTVHLSKPAGASGAASVANSGSLAGMVATPNADGSIDVLLPQGSYGTGRTETFNVYWPTANWNTDPSQPATTTMTANWSGGTVPNHDASIAVLADLKATLTKKTQTPSPVLYDQAVSYSIAMNFGGADSSTINHGMLNSHDLLITDPLPYGAEFVSCLYNTCKYDDVTRTVTWGPMTMDQMKNDGSYLYTVTYPAAGNKVGETAPIDQNVINTASYTATTDFTDKPLSGTATSPVKITDQRPTLSFGISKSAAGGWNGEKNFAWVISYSNKSPYTVDQLLAHDAIPAGFDAVSVTTKPWGPGLTAANQFARWTFTDGTVSDWVSFDTASDSKTRLYIPTADIAAHGRVTVVDIKSTNMPQGTGVDATIETNIAPDFSGGDPTQAQNCVDGTISNSGDSDVSSTSCFTTTVTAAAFPIPAIVKSLVNSTPVEPGGTQVWKFGFSNQSNNGSLLTPDLYDLMPNNVTYVPGSLKASTRQSNACPAASDFTESISPWTSASDPTTSATRVSWTVNPGVAGVPYVAYADPGSVCTYTYETVVNPGVPAKTYSGWVNTSKGTGGYLGNRIGILDHKDPQPKVSPYDTPDVEDFDGDGNTAEVIHTASAQFSVASSAVAGIHKYVEGDQDPANTWFDSAEIAGKSDQIGTSTPGGSVSYKVQLGNWGNKALTSLVAYDLLPDPASPGVTSGRYANVPPTGGYQWIPSMVGPIDAGGAPVTITYSTKTDPCRPEMDYSPSRTAPFYCGGAQDSSWVTADKVTDWSTIKSVRFDFSDHVFQPLDIYTFTWTMDAPTTLADGSEIKGGEQTWNKIAVQGRQFDNGNQLLAAEAPWVVDQMFVPKFAIGDYVWIDSNKDGIQDADEAPLADVTVKLFDKDGKAVKDVNGVTVADTTTDANGYYHFDKLPAGEYKVQFVLPDGYTFTTQYSGTDTTVDSNANELTGWSDVFTLGIDEGNTTKAIASDGVTADYIDRTIDAGVIAGNPKFAVGDFVWYDTNKDGVQSAGEAPVPGVTVELMKADGTVLDTTTTDANGFYHFDNLDAGDYKVKFSDLPAGYSFTMQYSGTDTTVDSNANVTTGESDVFTLGRGEDNVTASIPSDGVTAPFINRTIDAGIVAPTFAIGDFVWYDTNRDGMQSAGEAPVPGVTVELMKADGTVLDTTTTDANGYYHFDNLNAGDYKVKFSNIPADYSFTTQYSGTDTTIDSNANVTTGESDVFTLGMGEDNVTASVTSDGVTAPYINRTIDAGIVAPYFAIGDYVWNDANKNGIQDADEAPVAGVTVELMKPDGTVLKTTTTDANGYYHFDQLEAGDYKVKFSNIPDGYEFTSQYSGSDTTIDSNADVTTGESDVFTLGKGEDNVTASVASDGVTAPFINRTIDAGIFLTPVYNPAITIEKWSTVDGFPAGDFDAAPGKQLLPNVDEAITFTITNTGDEDLTKVVVSDSTVVGDVVLKDVTCDFSKLGGPTSGTTWDGPFAVDASFDCTGTLPGLAEGASHSDVAKVDAVGINSGKPVTANDPWNAWTAVQGPSIDLTKYSTSDGWPRGHYPTADEAKTLQVAANEDMSFTITNNGTEPLVNVSVVDKDLSGPALINLTCDFTPVGGPSSGTTFAGPVAPGATFSCTGLQPALAADQDASDIATVNADGQYSKRPVNADDKWYATAAAAPVLPTPTPSVSATPTAELPHTGAEGIQFATITGALLALGGIALLMFRRKSASQ